MFGGVSGNGGGAERIGEHETKSYAKISIVQVGGQSMAYPGPKDFLSQAHFSHVKWDCCEGYEVRGEDTGTAISVWMPIGTAVNGPKYF